MRLGEAAWTALMGAMALSRSADAAIGTAMDPSDLPFPPRYAVYAAPAADDALWRFGSSVIGTDAEAGADIGFPAGPPFDRPDWADLTAAPRLYGFHGTLKAPFRLGDGLEEQDFLEAVALFAARRTAFSVPDLTVRLIGRFVALVPVEASDALAALATDCVRDLDAFRAPLTAAERERRLQAPLTARQVAQLDGWGYPYIFDDFRFHMTLTGPLPEAIAADIAGALAAVWERHRAPLRLNGLAVFRQDRPDGRFALIARLPFAG